VTVVVRIDPTLYWFLALALVLGVFCGGMLIEEKTGKWWLALLPVAVLAVFFLGTDRISGGSSWTAEEADAYLVEEGIARPHGVSCFPIGAGLSEEVEPGGIVQRGQGAPRPGVLCSLKKPAAGHGYQRGAIFTFVGPPN
jgi:hypothetical protein